MKLTFGRILGFTSATGFSTVFFAVSGPDRWGSFETDGSFNLGNGVPSTVDSSADFKYLYLAQDV